MKTILSALVAVSVIAGVAGTANAAIDAKTFFEQVDRDHNYRADAVPRRPARLLAGRLALPPQKSPHVGVRSLG